MLSAAKHLSMQRGWKPFACLRVTTRTVYPDVVLEQLTQRAGHSSSGAIRVFLRWVCA